MKGELIEYNENFFESIKHVDEFGNIGMLENCKVH